MYISNRTELINSIQVSFYFMFVQVKRISVSTSTEDTTGKPKLWLLQRDCSENCEPGCIIIGERTKLHSCITCCENSFCNSGSGAEAIINIEIGAILLTLCFALTLIITKE